MNINQEMDETKVELSKVREQLSSKNLEIEKLSEYLNLKDQDLLEKDKNLRNVEATAWKELSKLQTSS